MKTEKMKVHAYALKRIPTDTDDVHEYIDGMSNEELEQAEILIKSGKDEDRMVQAFRKHANVITAEIEMRKENDPILVLLDPDSDAAHEWISSNLSNDELVTYSKKYPAYRHVLEAEKEMREEAGFDDENHQFDIHAEDAGGPFYLEGKKIADNQIELAQWMKEEDFFPNVWIDQDGRGNPEILNFDPDAILVEGEIEDEKYLERKYKEYSFEDLVNMINKLNDDTDNVADVSDIEEEIEDIEAEMARRLTEKKEFSVGGKRRSNTSGWSKLKQELPTSAAASNRLSEGGHSPQYTKVLEELKRYWEKRGK